jgi:shikimate dehydrogenase
MTKQYGLIGYPLKNSFSEMYFNNRFEAEELTDCFYQNFAIEDISQFPAWLASNPNLKGFNITIPHKQSVIPFLDELDKTAQFVGAVNCVNKEPNGQWKGYNTDVIGFEKSLQPLLDGPCQALVLGTGGASKAVEYVLQTLGIPYMLVSRNPEPNQLGYPDITTEIINSHTLLINCTPLGMFPNIDEAPVLPYHLITKAHIAYDLIYLPAETLFLSNCRKQGATVCNGLNMLYGQAAEAWEIWQPQQA